MSEGTTVRTEDLVPVGSRVSWGPIFAGAAVSLALWFLLTLLGGAIGWSVSGDVRAENLATGGAIWAVISTALALFAGGYITSQFSVGENKIEALTYGVIMWAVVFGMLLWLMASGVRAGFSAMVGMATVGRAAAGDTGPQDWEAAARKAGVTQEQLDEWRKKASEAGRKARETTEDPQNQRAAAEAVTAATWWAFAVTLLSMFAAVGGALVGSGPSFRLLAVTITRRGATRP